MFERFTAEARLAVVEAQEAARELKAHRVGTDHVFLGVLRSADSRLRAALAEEGLTIESARLRISRGVALGDADAEALESIGIDLDAVRSSLEATFGAGALDVPVDPAPGWLRRKMGHIAFTPAAKKVLELSLREAIARQDSEIGSEHLLFGLIRGADPAFVGLVDDPERLRVRLEALLGRAA